jgi:surfeit locus 1 family protein
LNASRARFRAPPWAIALTALSVAIFSGLGLWQLRRSEEKRAFFAAFDAPAGGAVLTRPIAESQLPSLNFAFVRLHGQYDGARQLLLDARPHAGRNGYEVLTPLRTADGAVLVNRGWVAAPARRSELPDVGVTGAQREITGRLTRLPLPGLRTGAAPPGDSGWPRRLLFPTADEISRALGYRVHDYQVLLAPGEPDGFARDWRPAVMSPAQHLAYAVQWFALAVTVIIVFVIRNLSGGSDR